MQGWLAGWAYKPGFHLDLVQDLPSATLYLVTDALLFDSTHPAAVRILRNRSIAVAIPTPAMDTAWTGDTTVIEQTSYDVGPDLVGGPLVHIGRRSPVPPYLLPAEGHDRTGLYWSALEHAFRRWVRSQLHELEAHEADEWFRDAGTGKPFFDPHAGV